MNFRFSQKPKLKLSTIKMNFRFSQKPKLKCGIFEIKKSDGFQTKPKFHNK